MRSYIIHVESVHMVINSTETEKVIFAGFLVRMQSKKASYNWTSNSKCLNY